METAVRRERSETLETQLYGGSMVNARDLEALQQEAANVRHMLGRDEALSLDLSIQAEESQTKCASLSLELAEIKARWEMQQAELNRKVSELRAEQSNTNSSGNSWPEDWTKQHCNVTRRCESQKGAAPSPGWSATSAKAAGCRCPPNCASG